MELSKQESKNLKAQQKLLKSSKEKKEIHKSIELVNCVSQDQLTVICVKFGNGYGREYVERLRNMVSRNLTLPYKFVCLTDDSHPIDGVESIVQQNKCYPKQWWHKVHMFDPSLPLSGRILYLDLDVVILNSIDKLVLNLGNGFFGIRDFNRKFHASWQQLNSSAMTWIHSSQSTIYQKFIKDPAAAMRLHGDQDWIWKTAKHDIKFWNDRWIQSYKWEIRHKEELVSRNGRRGFKTVKTDTTVDTECSIAVFHGSPNPADVQDKIVIDNWR
jgi:hypothetical protein